MKQFVRHGSALLGALVILAVVAAPAFAGKAVKPGTPTALAPSGSTYDTAPTFSWTAATNAATYNLSVYKGKKVVASHTGVVGLTWASPALPLSVSLTWKVQAVTSTGTAGAYSASLTFMVIPLTVGASFQDGKVAYIFQPGDPGYVAGQTHGLVVAVGALVQDVHWAPCVQDFTNPPSYCAVSPGPTAVGGTSTGLGTGQANTNRIVAAYGSVGVSYAALLMSNVHGPTWSGSWYLPSLDELTKLCINHLLLYPDWSGLGSLGFWSSSEIDTDNAWTSQWGAPCGSPASQLAGHKYTTSIAIPMHTF